MPYALGDHVSYCQVDAQIIFLDLRADRYSCLDPEKSVRFSRWLAEGGLATLDTIGLGSLERRKLIVACPQAGRLGPCGRSTPAASLYDATLASAGAVETIAAVRSLAAMAGLLRLRPLRETIARVMNLKETRFKPDDEPRLRSIVSAHRRLSLLTTEHGSCLLRSCALASHLRARRIAFQFVFGVKLGTFAAHCWLERDGFILNDTQDHVSAFTPIVAI